jgi:hypothetical protein
MSSFHTNAGFFCAAIVQKLLYWIGFDGIVFSGTSTVQKH